MNRWRIWINIVTLAALTCFVATVSFGIAAAAPRLAISFSVNSNGDQPDINLSDGLCNTANNNCTLRAALEEANTSQAGYQITFASNMTITPLSPLPALERDGITINGVGRTIILDGAQAGLTASGITIMGSSGHVIQRLTIRNWGHAGIVIDGTIGVAQNNLIGTDGDGNGDAEERVILEDNQSMGIKITGAFATGNVVAGNIIGRTTRPNQAGVLFFAGAHHNLVGTDGNGIADAAERNLINGNSNVGVGLLSATHNTIAGNYIGLDANGSTPAGNGGGIGIGEGANFNLIGTDGDGLADADERNVISANTSLGGGIYIAESTGNTIAGNYIGTNATGASARGNLSRGITLMPGANGNIIGTNSDGFGDDHEGNLISANGGITGFYGGLVLLGVQRNTIAGNLIGTDASGALALGNIGPGIAVSSGSSTNIVGTDGNGLNDALEGNLISGNSAAGIVVSGPYNTISGNKIGTDITGSNGLGNSMGIYLLSIQGSDASFNLIGGSSAAQANMIAFNSSEGIRIEGVSGSAPVENLLLTNFIFSNDSLGIDLASSLDPVNGVTSNDQKDLDQGANELLNTPEVLTAVSVGGKTYGVVQISNGLRDSNFHIQLFSNADCDPSGFGEGQTYIGQLRLSTDESGNAVSGMVAFDGATPRGYYLTATATLHEDQPVTTSEFSACKQVETNLRLAPRCSVKDSFFDLQESPLQSAFLLVLTPIVLGFAGIGLGTLLSRWGNGDSFVRSRRIGGAMGSVIGLAALGIISQWPSCSAPITLELPPRNPPTAVATPTFTPGGVDTPTATPTEEPTPTSTATPAGVSLPISELRFSNPTIYYESESCGPMTLEIQAMANNPNIYSLVMFFRLVDLEGPFQSEWTSLVMDPAGNGLFTQSIHAEADIPGFDSIMRATIQVQLVATDINSVEVARTAVLNDVTLEACGG